MGGQVGMFYVPDYWDLPMQRVSRYAEGSWPRTKGGFILDQRSLDDRW